jgi:hypothetical protein
MVKINELRGSGSQVHPQKIFDSYFQAAVMGVAGANSGSLFSSQGVAEKAFEIAVRCIELRDKAIAKQAE